MEDLPSSRFMDATFFSTGLPGLDRALRGILPGDNVVWQFDSVSDYQALIPPFCESARKSGRPLVYFRFAEHPPLLPEDSGADIHIFKPEDGFETFTGNIHRVIRDKGRGAYYVFDCLSVLATCWFSDQMLGNFFQLTCPYLFDLETLAYFGLFRHQHSSEAILPIQTTTQLFLDLYEHKGRRYVRPLKVQHRFSATMNMLHLWQGESFTPVGDSAVIAEILTSARWSGLHSDRRPGFWERSFLDAQEVLDDIEAGNRLPAEAHHQAERLLPMIITRDERIGEMAGHYMTLSDILDVRRRMIGTGLIGGKAVGMLLARAILKNKSPRFGDLLEAHDSFFIGSDVFYTYLVRNGIWSVRQQQRDSEDFYENATRARRLIVTGTFPTETVVQFQEMLDYFGQSPFIVRSSSLLEDNFGNAFAGKYESVFCANQGPRAQRLEDFMAAVRAIYASSMSERALRYRAQRGMLDKDEQMALLVMRVSGRPYARKFYPPLAGVGFSFNPYVWSDTIDPKAGVIRLVFGLGTRAVDRSDDDYTRLVALNAPERRPEQNVEELRQYTQRKVDYIDLDDNRLASGFFTDLAPDARGLPLDLVSSSDTSSRELRELRAHGRNVQENRILTFDRLLKETPFVEQMREMLRILHEAYNHPVDIEFTANFLDDGSYRINLLQCRPLQVHGSESVDLPQIVVPEEDRIVAARGAVIGQSRVVDVDRFIYVRPSVYGQLPVRDRYEVVSVLGHLNRLLPPRDQEVTVLLGPGRWCTSSPSLGIPVAFADINRVSIVCEIVAMHRDLIPDVSLGTHFLNELVEMDMLYLALFPSQGGNVLNEKFFLENPSRLLDYLPDAARWLDGVRVVETAALRPRVPRVRLVANAVEQKVDCFVDAGEDLDAPSAD
jgi:hypothetical protein